MVSVTDRAARGAPKELKRGGRPREHGRRYAVFMAGYTVPRNVIPPGVLLSRYPSIREKSATLPSVARIRDSSLRRF